MEETVWNRVVIIDDEPLVRQGIGHLIDWEKQGFIIVAEGIDGKDGLEKIEQYNPDLVLTDIKMPELDGLEVIRQAKRAGFDGEFIILTGYAEFELARAALSLGVREYLLKPIDEDELEATIVRLREHFEQKHQQTKWKENRKKHQLKELFWRLMNTKEMNESLKDACDTWLGEQEKQDFCVVIAQAKQGKDNAPPEAEEYIESILYGLSNAEYWPQGETVFILIEGKEYKEIAQRLEENSRRLLKRGMGDWYFYVGQTVKGAENICYSMECAKYLMNCRFLYHKERALTIDIIAKKEIEKEEASAEYLFHLIETGKQKQLQKSLYALLDGYRNQLLDELQVKIRVAEKLMRVSYFLLERGEQTEAINPHALYERIYKSQSMDAIMESAWEYCRGFCEKYQTQNTSDGIVQQMYDYMERHYAENIKLETIARTFHYNSAYLGTLFRKEKKDTFNNLLDKIRIEEAKRLLVETELKIYQIAKQTGYTDTDYFCMKFKKYTGTSPREYRNLQKTT